MYNRLVSGLFIGSLAAGTIALPFNACAENLGIVTWGSAFARAQVGIETPVFEREASTWRFKAAGVAIKPGESFWVPWGTEFMRDEMLSVCLPTNGRHQERYIALSSQIFFLSNIYTNVPGGQFSPTLVGSVSPEITVKLWQGNIYKGENRCSPVDEGLQEAPDPLRNQ